MRAVTWHGKRDVRVDTVPDPRIEEPTDAIIEITSTNICGSDLHLYEMLGAFMNAGRHPRPRADGHRPGGGQRGDQSGGRRPGGHPVPDLLRQLLHVRPAAATPSARRRRSASRAWARRCSATPSSTARCPAGRPSCCACRRRSSPTSRCPTGRPDSRFVYLSDVLPTAWQAVAYADVPDGGSVTVLGLGPIGDMAARIAAHLGYDVIAVDLVPERLARAEARGHPDRRPRRARRRPRRRHPRADRRARHRLGHRRRRDGGARLAGRQDRPAGHRSAAGRARQADDAEGRRRPARRAVLARSTSSGAAAPSR